MHQNETARFPRTIQKIRSRTDTSFVFDKIISSSESKLNCAAGCGSIATTRCSRCAGADYCGKECQTRDWPSHKAPCKAAVAAAATAAAAEAAEAETAEAVAVAVEVVALLASSSPTSLPLCGAGCGLLPMNRCSLCWVSVIVVMNARRPRSLPTMDHARWRQSRGLTFSVLPLSRASIKYSEMEAEAGNFKSQINLAYATRMALASLKTSARRSNGTCERPREGMRLQCIISAAASRSALALLKTSARRSNGTCERPSMATGPPIGRSRRKRPSPIPVILTHCRDARLAPRRVSTPISYPEIRRAS